MEITFDYKQALDFFNEQDISAMQDKVEKIHEHLHKRNENKNDYKGWVELPENHEASELQRIEQIAKKINAHSEILLVIGVGGSYLGAKAAIDMLQHQFFSLLPDAKKQTAQIIFAGHTLSTTYIEQVKDVLKDRDFSINVISKSGTTTEPAIALRIFKNILIDRYGKEKAKDRIFVTTDQSKGALLSLAETNNYERLVIPRDVGGRYSVLTAVGLLPMAVSGIDIFKVMQGAKLAYKDLQTASLNTNGAYQYAVVRNILYDQGKTTELLASYEPNLAPFSKWWQQLFGESEGKNKQGIYPSYVNFPADLHAIGQYIQEGRRDLFETTIKVNKQANDEYIHYDKKNLDGLNYLAGKSLETINDKVYQAAVLAHSKGEVPNLTIHVPIIEATTFGYLAYFFQKACAMSSYLFNVNPFDQPGVEAYKENMYALLGKPGFEKERERLEKLLNSRAGGK